MLLLKIFVITFIFLNLSLAAPQCTDYNVLTVKGSSISKLNGEYRILPYQQLSTCFNQNIWIQNSIVQPTYLYYLKKAWFIGYNFCDTDGLARCDMTFSSMPFDINNKCIWKEADSESVIMSNSYSPNYKMSVVCSSIYGLGPGSWSVGVVVSILCAVFLFLLICTSSIIAVKRRLHNDGITRRYAQNGLTSAPADISTLPNYLQNNPYPNNVIISAPKYEDLFPNSTLPSYQDAIKSQTLENSDPIIMSESGMPNPPYNPRTEVNAAVYPSNAPPLINSFANPLKTSLINQEPPPSYSISDNPNLHAPIEDRIKTGDASGVDSDVVANLAKESDAQNVEPSNAQASQPAYSSLLGKVYDNHAYSQE